MNTKILSIFMISIYLGSFLNIAYGEAFHGHVEQTNNAKIQNELFTGKAEKLGRNDLLIMTVSQVLDSSFSKENDEFFAEVTDDIEVDGGILIPLGTIAHGRIKQLACAKRLGIDGALDLDFDYLITPDGREIPIKGKMSTKLHPIISTSKILATDIGYTAAGGVAGGIMGLSWFGLSNAVASQGSTIAGGAAIGGTIGLGAALYRKGKNVLISPGDEIRVKINTSEPLPVYKNTALLQHEFRQEGLDVEISDIAYEKNPFGEIDTINLALSISNETKINFSIYDMAIINNYNTIYYPATFGSDKTSIVEIKPGDKVTVKIPFSVDNVKHKFWLIFYDKKNKSVIAKISINNAYRKISDKSKMQNEKVTKKKLDFYKESSTFVGY